MTDTETKVDPNIFKVDVDHLDVEWNRHASLCFTFGQEEVKAQYKVNEIKRRLNVARVQASLKIRNNPSSYDLSGRLTEAKLASKVEDTEEVQNLCTELNEAEKHLGICTAAVKALLEKRKYMEAQLEFKKMNYRSFQ